MKNLEQKVKFLTLYAIGSSLFMGFMLFSSFESKLKSETFDEITVKRINVIENDGTLRMVLSNKEKQHSGRMDGKDWEKRERPSGMIFFNDEGDECGGLIYQAKSKEGKTISGMSITMDKYKDDQVVQLLNNEMYNGEKGQFERGLKINSYPVKSHLVVRNKKIEELSKLPEGKEKEEKINQVYKEMGSVNRLFLGQTRGNSSGLFLADKEGNPKLMIYVDEQGNPKIQTLDKEGKSIDFIR